MESEITMNRVEGNQIKEGNIKAINYDIKKRRIRSI